MSNFQHYFYEKNGYKYIVSATTVKGKSFRGVASCNPKDEYNEELGIQLADLRCLKKIKEYKFKKVYSESIYLNEAIEQFKKQLEAVTAKGIELAFEVNEVNDKIGNIFVDLEK